jgi:hypothetical protein
MVVKDLFKKPVDRKIEGVVTIGNEAETQIFQELDEYVTTSEVVSELRKFFSKYRQSLTSTTTGMGVWITGYFGSGKSHFLKMLGYILENKQVNGKKAIDFFKEKIQDQIILADMEKSAKAKNKVVLFNIDAKASADTKNKSQAITLIMLKAFNEAIGLSGTTPWVADMERELIKAKVYEKFQERFAQYAKKDWKKEGRNQAFLNRDSVVKALVDSHEMDLDSAKKYFDDLRYHFDEKITSQSMAEIINDYCLDHSERVVFLMDEVGQFVGNNGALMLNLQTCVEELGKHCHGKAWVVVTSQQDLKIMVGANQDKKNDFSKITARFETRISLSGAEAGEVIKKRILEKKEQVHNSLEVSYEKNSSRLANLIMFDGKPTWTGYKSKEEFRDVYPFVSYQFQLLQKVFEQVREHGMTEGKHLSQSARSLLNAFQQSSIDYGSKDLNALVPFDNFYSTVENFIDYNIKTVFAHAEERGILKPFDLRVLRLLFMIKYVKDMPGTLDRLTTMMVESVFEDKLALREKIKNSLKTLEEETLIQQNGDVYDFLTDEEQDVNREIRSTSHNEGEILRTISDIFFESILQDNKIKYKRYDFPFNRLVENEPRGANNPNNITCKIITGIFGEKNEMELRADSSGWDVILVDLQNGNFIQDLIQANKIEIYKKNHWATMSSAVAQIVERKTAEASERRKRAEDSIRAEMKKANIYSNGTLLSLGNKDGRERLGEALNKLVQTKYYQLGKVVNFYDTAQDISTELEKNDLFGWPNGDGNNEAYDEIKDKLKNDKNFNRISTIKSMVDYFSKSPYGWKELDIRGMIAVLWKYNVIKLDIHGRNLSLNNANDKWEVSRGTKMDQVAASLQEKVSDETLNEIKRILNRIFGENHPLNETKLREAILDGVKTRVERLNSIRIKYESENYPGKSKITDLLSEMSLIIKNESSDWLFEKIKEKASFLEDNASVLDEILSFYQLNSAQLQVWHSANDIVKWYFKHQLTEDLSDLVQPIEQINEILKKEIPFSDIPSLSQLVSASESIKEKIVKAKKSAIKEKLEKDLVDIREESNLALPKLNSEKGKLLQDKLDATESLYLNYFKALETDDIPDRYVSVSNKNLNDFKEFVKNLLVTIVKGKKTKNVKLLSLIPTANKKLATKEEIEKVLNELKKKLADELNNVDEIYLE